MPRASYSAVLVFFLATAFLQAATYYVATSGNDTAAGTSWGTAWASIDREQPTRLSAAVAIGATTLPVYNTDSFLATGTLKIDSETVAYTNKSATLFYLSSALTAAHVDNSLVYDNAFSGGNGFDGGDLILVNAGVYTQQVELCDSGASGASRITYQATNGSVVVDGGGVRAYGFMERGVAYVTVDGFDITGATSHGIYLYERTALYDIIRNCVIYNNGGNGILADLSYNAAGTSHMIQNCTIVGNGGAGVYMYVAYGSIVNSVLMGNRYGAFEQYGYAFQEMKNNCFYGNGINLFDAAYGTFNSAAEINAIPFPNGCQSNIVQNPGFVDFYRWTFNRVYAGSGLIGGATDGGAIGRHQTLATMPVSSAHYYVAPPSQGGSDANPGTVGSPWATISKSATRAIAGDTVHVASGTYAEEVAITNSGAEGLPVVYRAEGNAIVDGIGNAFRLQRVAGVILDGFTTMAASTAGVACLEYSCGNSLQNITSFSNALYGIYLERSRGNLISQGTVFTNNSHGIYLYNSQAIIRDSQVYSNNAAGIYFYFVYGATVSNCDVAANKTYGVYLEQAMFNTIARSGIHHNKSSGVHHLTDTSVNWPNLVEGCRIYENTGCGVQSEMIYAYLNVVNCAIYFNKSHGGFVGTNAKGLNFQNCTIWGNLGSGIRQDHYLAAYRQKIVNCIIGSNAQFGISQNYGLQNIDCLNNLFFTNTAGNYYDVNTHTTNNTAEEINAVANSANNLVADPSFRYPTPDFRLNYTSPAVDAGTTNAAALVRSLAYLPVDLYGNPRLHGANIDIGCFEGKSPVGAMFKFH